MANYDSTTTRRSIIAGAAAAIPAAAFGAQPAQAADAAATEWESRVIEILARGVLDVLPESPERAGRVLRRAHEMHAEIAARGPTAMAEAMMRVRE